MKKVFILFIFIALLISGCNYRIVKSNTPNLNNNEGPKIVSLKLKDDTNEYVNYERNYLNDFTVEIGLNNYKSDQNYIIVANAFQNNDVPVSSAKIIVDKNINDYKFLISSNSSIDQNSKYQPCKNLIVSAELCLLKNNDCFGAAIDRKETFLIASCGE